MLVTVSKYDEILTSKMMVPINWPLGVCDVMRVEPSGTETHNRDCREFPAPSVTQRHNEKRIGQEDA